MIKVTIYNEFVHEKTVQKVADIYPDGIHNAIKRGIEDAEIVVRTVTLDSVSELTEQLLADTDVLIWWGHMHHGDVPDDISNRVKEAVLHGMGAIFLHSAHHSKPFKMLMGTSCNLAWREDDERELLWVTDPSHPITEGIDRFIHILHEETYCEPFAIPEPDKTLFIANYEGGDVLRAGCCWQRENGKIFYFQPGHETYPIYYQKEVLQVIKNAVKWANPTYRKAIKSVHSTKPLGE